VPGPRLGIAMADRCDLEHRVRSLLRDNPWRDKLDALASTAMVIVMIGMSTVVLVGCKTKPAQYVSMAKLVAGGRVVSSTSTGPQYQEYLQDFYGTIIETLESAEMRRHALERVRALNPDLKEADVDIHVTQNKGSAIFNIAAIGTDPKFTRVFLDALLDEFRAFREQIREQQRNKALTAMAEDVMKREAVTKEKSAKLEAFQRSNNIVVLTNRQSQVADLLRQMMLEKNRLLLELSDLELTEKDVESSLAQRRATSAPGASVNAEQGLTQAEADYLRTRSELAVCKIDIEVLTESKTPDAAKLEEAMQRKSRLEKLLRLYASEITDSVKGRKANLERLTSTFDKKVEGLTNEASELGAKLAEFSRLTKDHEDSDKAYHEMFDLVHKFQVNEEMGGDYVSIMERASGAVEDIKPWWSF
jgi:capsule polysaccharide export protein KpsE/RkpR